MPGSAVCLLLQSSLKGSGHDYCENLTIVLNKVTSSNSHRFCNFLFVTLQIEMNSNRRIFSFSSNCWQSAFAYERPAGVFTAASCRAELYRGEPDPVPQLHIQRSTARPQNTRWVNTELEYLVRQSNTECSLIINSPKTKIWWVDPVKNWLWMFSFWTNYFKTFSLRPFQPFPPGASLQVELNMNCVWTKIYFCLIRIETMICR